MQRNNLNARIRRGNLRHQLDGIGLVVLNADICLVYLYSLHQDGNAYHDFLGMFQHQLMVGRQIRLALYGVDDDTLGLESGRRTQLHLRGEASATHTYNARVGNLLYYFLRSQITFLHQCVGAVNALFPFVSFYINEDGRFRIAAGIDNGINLGHLSADRRVDGR